MIRFDISDLRIFVNVVQAGSITHGAERSNRAVASISSRIAQMELEMGVPLLIRLRGGVVPTEAGKKLLNHGFRLLNEVQRMHDDLAEYGSRGKSFIKLYSNTVGLYEFLQEPIAEFLRVNPGTTLTLEEMMNDQIAQAVLEGKADVGLVAEPVDTRDLETIAFAIDRYVIIAPPTWDRVSGDRGRFEDFVAEDLVGPGRGSWMHTVLQEHAAAHGKPLRNLVQLRNFAMACELVASGVGIGIVPASSAARMRDQLDFRIIHLDDAWAELPLKLCMRRRADLGERPAALVDFLLSHSQAHSLPSLRKVAG